MLLRSMWALALSAGCVLASAPAAVAAPAPSAPTNVRASDVTTSSVRLTWDSAARAKSYDVQVGDYQSSTTSTAFTFTQLQACTAYTLSVRSRNANRTSAWSSVNATTTGCATTTAPVEDSDLVRTVSPEPTSSPTPGLRVSGNQLVDENGTAVQLHGVNRSGYEYACIQGWGISDGPDDDASVRAIRSWNSNLVHIGLNEHCILGINGVKPEYGGGNYMKSVVDYVERLHANGMYAEVSLMWSAPGTTPATGHPLILNRQHSPAALRAIANAFKDDPKTIIGLQSEPRGIGWACWRDGGAACSVGYEALGMQAALDAVRSTGATNPVTVSGINYANDLSQWLTYKPVDPAGQLVAEAHVYGKNACASVACFDTHYKPVAARVPLLFGEVGETYDDSSCGSSNTLTFLKWADANGVSYAPWVWNRWGTCGSLIRDYAGTPNGTYGDYVRTHLLSRP